MTSKTKEAAPQAATTQPVRELTFTEQFDPATREVRRQEIVKDFAASVSPVTDGREKAAEHFAAQARKNPVPKEGLKGKHVTREPHVEVLPSGTVITRY